MKYLTIHTPITQKHESIVIVGFLKLYKLKLALTVPCDHVMVAQGFVNAQHTFKLKLFTLLRQPTKAWLISMLQYVLIVINKYQNLKLVFLSKENLTLALLTFTLI